MCIYSQTDIQRKKAMDELVSTGKKPLVGFFPVFYNLAETGRAVLIAKRYIELGGEAVFFSHGGEYEYLAKDLGCEVIRVHPIYTKEFIDRLWKASRLETLRNPYSTQDILDHVEGEISAYKKTSIKLIVSTNNTTCVISARVLKIPLIFVRSRFNPQFTYYPEDAEILFTHILPEWLKLKILNWYFPHAKHYLPPFVKVAKKYHVTPPKTGHALTKGDYTFYTDFQQLANIKDDKHSPDEYYIGPIFFDELIKKNIEKNEVVAQEEAIHKHLKRKGRSILISLGSSGTREMFIKMLELLNNTDYTVIGVFTSILKDDELPAFNENILLRKFVPSLEKIFTLVDLAIIHGGQGTVYTAAYAGKPVIGFPMLLEQHSNLEMLARQGMAKIASRKSIEKNLLPMIKDIFDNYDEYLTKAQSLSKRLPKPDGDRIAAHLIYQIISKNA